MLSPRAAYVWHSLHFSLDIWFITWLDVPHPEKKQPLLKIKSWLTVTWNYLSSPLLRNMVTNYSAMRALIDRQIDGQQMVGRYQVYHLPASLKLCSQQGVSSTVNDRILAPCNYCHHPWCIGHKSYHKALLIMFGCDGISDHASWNEVFHYWDIKLSWSVEICTE